MDIESLKEQKEIYNSIIEDLDNRRVGVVNLFNRATDEMVRRTPAYGIHAHIDREAHPITESPISFYRSISNAFENLGHAEAIVHLAEAAKDECDSIQGEILRNLENIKSIEEEISKKTTSGQD